MAGTIGPAAKAHIIGALAALPALDGVQVAYSFPGRNPQREIVYGGKLAGPVTPAAMRAGQRVTRREDLALSLHIYVIRPGLDSTEETDTRAAAIGQAVEEYLAGDPTLGGAVDGLKLAVITNVDLDSGLDDESAITELTYQITLVSHVR